MKASKLIQHLQQLPPDTDVPLAALALVMGEPSPADVFTRMARAGQNPSDVIARLMEIKPNDQ